MHQFQKLALIVVSIAGYSFGAGKPHVIAFGKPLPAKWFVGLDESQPVDIKVRPLYIDARLKEFTLGLPHDVTDHLFVVRRAFHVNDSLPQWECHSQMEVAAWGLAFGGPRFRPRLATGPAGI